MMVPSIFAENFFDDWFDFPSFVDFSRVERKPNRRPANRLMRTDVREKDGSYELEIDLPGFDKEDISLELENGSLKVSAVKKFDNEEKDDRGVLIRRERYSGSMHRSFYIGEDVKEDDIKAKFDRGVLKLTVPKPEAKKIPEKKTIAIE